MKYIISGTNRPGSRTKQISLLVQKLYQDLGEKVEIIDLAELPMNELTGHQYSDKVHEGVIKTAIQKVNTSEGIIMVVPEYNGSMPGVLKYFIDHWKYPDTFEQRPVCYIGLGGLFGGLRPVEHLMQVFSYRQAYNFPVRVFLMNIWNTLKDGVLHDEKAMELLKRQASEFQKFTKALSEYKIDANALNAARIQK